MSRKLPRHSGLWLPLLALLVCAAQATAAVLSVPAQYATIAAAVTAAVDGDEVVVAPGTYAQGASFGGKAITVRSTDPLDAGVVAGTIIDGGSFTFDHSEGPGSVLAGFTIRNHSLTIGHGGAVYCHDSSPTITHNIISGNRTLDSSVGFGAGLYIEGGAPVVSFNTISGNQSAYYGGGISLEGSSAAISNNVINGNSSVQSGGGVFTNGGSPIICGNLVVGNHTSSGSGGGFYLSTGAVARNNTIVGNSTVSGNGAGGAYLMGGTLRNCIVAFNTGGGVRAGATAAIRYCDVYGNTGSNYTDLDATGQNGNLSADPLFADLGGGDYHVLSILGRWTGSGWTVDAAHSPCIDAGDPTSTYDNEPLPNGNRVNLGVYGNTTEASKGTGIHAPSIPTTVTISPGAPKTADDLTASAGGATDPDGDMLSYEYEWAEKAGGVWGAFGNPGATLPAALTLKSRSWKARVRAYDGLLYGPWLESAAVIIGDTGPTAPTEAHITPAAPGTDDTLVPHASGAVDPDGDEVAYFYSWSSSNDGTNWSAWSSQAPKASDTTRGQYWKIEALARCYGLNSPWTYSEPVQIGDTPPTPPASVTVGPAGARTGDDLTAAAVGGSDTDGDAVTYEYQWSVSSDGGDNWSPWGHDGPTLAAAFTAKAEQWRAQARSVAGGARSDWVTGNTVVIADTAPEAPTSVEVAPAAPGTEDNLSGAALGGDDSDGEAVSYEYQWSVSTDGGATWSAWGHDGATLPAALTTRGEQWKAQARSVAGGAHSDWVAGNPVTIIDSPPTVPTAVAITPAHPATGDSLTASASGAADSDDDPLSYEYQWSVSTDGGESWSEWGNDGATIGADLTTKGEQWRVRGRSLAGGVTSAWVTATAVTIGNSAPSAPTAVSVTPAAPRGGNSLTATAAGAGDADAADTVRYEYQWACRPRGGDWSNWADGGAVAPGADVAKGQQWKARARATDLPAAPSPQQTKGDAEAHYSIWVQSAVITVVDTPPTAPTAVTATPAHPRTASDLTAAASGADDVDGDAVGYEYEWACSADAGAHWGAWRVRGAVLSADLTTKGEQWRARARAVADGVAGPWAKSAVVTIEDTVPQAPLALRVAPLRATVRDDLAACAEGAVDADGDPIDYHYEWRCSEDGGASWLPWTWPRRVLTADQLHKGQLWQARAQATSGTPLKRSGWLESAVATVEDCPPGPPATLTVTPQPPASYADLTARAAGAVDADDDPLAYEYEWARSRDGGATWQRWMYSGAVLPGATVGRDRWRVRARACSGTPVRYSGWISVDVAPLLSPSGAGAIAAVAEASATPAGTVNIRVGLSGAAAVRARVLNLAGKEVAVLSEASSEAGLLTLSWNGRSRGGTMAPPGVYVVEITACAPQGAAARTVVRVAR